jgi:hypothetical protein
VFHRNFREIARSTALELLSRSHPLVMKLARRSTYAARRPASSVRN